MNIHRNDYKFEILNKKFYKNDNFGVEPRQTMNLLYKTTVNEVLVIYKIEFLLIKKVLHTQINTFKINNTIFNFF